jgi:linoleoyl-CoA desaturase
MFLLYFAPYTLILTGVISGSLALLSTAVIMGLGMAGIGLSVMHDANHGAYSKKAWINDTIGYSLNLLGATSYTWKLQHNVLHHTYTNIHEEDEDISPRGILRFNPHTDWKSYHRYQFVYAWPLYGLMTLVWLLFKDISRLKRYQQTGLVTAQKGNVMTEWLILFATKIFFISYSFVIPLLFTSLLWWQIVIGILVMHFVAGFVLAIIFQPAHVIEGTEFPLPDEDRTIENNWAIHQLHTTTNFGNRSKWFSWYVGGLNFQIEHHLFPNVCHVHYRKISGIVQATASEFGLPYKTSRTFVQALIGHGRLLKQLGERPVASLSTPHLKAV